MTPVMEVLDGRSTSTPNGAPSPAEPSLQRLDLGGLSPSKGCVSRECSPERVSSDPSSPRPLEGSPAIQNEEEAEEEDGGGDVAPPEPSSELQSALNSDPLPEEEEERLIPSDQREDSPEFTETKITLHLESSLTPREEPDLDEERIKDHDIEEQSRDDEDATNESPADFRVNSLHRVMLCRNQEEGLSQMEPSNYSLHSSVLEDRGTPVREDDLAYAEDQGSTDPELSEHPHHAIETISSVGEHSQQLSESGSHLSNDDLRMHQHSLLEDHHRLSLQESLNTLEEHHNHLQNQHQSYNDQQQCHMQEYQYPLLKIPSHLQDPMRDQQGHLHDYDEHQHSLGDQRHLQDPLGEHLHLHHHHHPQTERSHGYWNVHLGMLSKVKTETKDWCEREGLVSDALGNAGLLKPSDQHDIYNSYRIPSHPSLGSESPRPSPIPHGGLPYAQSPDQRQHQAQHQQHYQAYQNHAGMRDMSPMSPKYQGHPRSHLQPSLHGASQFPGAQHHGIQHPGLQHPPQHHPGNQHLQQQYAQQYGGQQQLNLQGHPGQQLASPYAQGLMGSIGGPVGHRGHEGREGREGDPYSFVDEYSGPPPRPVEEILGHAQPKRRGRKPKHIKLMENGGDPLAIAAAQAAHEAKKRKWRQMGPDGKPLPLPVKPRKRIDRFDGISEDELSKKILPDHLGPNLDIVIISKFPFQIGINPGLFAAYKGHHYAGPGNHFWKCLFLSGLIPEPLTSDDDHQLLDHGIGFTNIVSRTTRGSAELTRKEIKEGGQILLAKLQRFQPRVAVFNGKGIYEIFSGKKEFTFGRQPEKIEGTHTHVWVMPSSSARCAQLPRALDKVPFYTALRKFRDFLKGTITELTEEEVTFTCPKNNRHLKDCEKLDAMGLEDDLCDPFLDDSMKDDLDSSRFESDLDSEEISRSISQSLYNLSGMTREQLEALDCPTIPIRKKRGRPKKAPEDPNAPPRPKPRSFPTELLLCNGEEPPRKKRGRPKKVLEDGSIPTPKRPGRKPKALKEMLAQQGPLGGPGIPQNPHAQMGMGHPNGMMSPSGYNNNPIGPFSPQFGGPQVHPGDIMSSVHGVGTPNPPHGMGNHPGLGGSHNSMHGHGPLLSGPGLSSLHPPGCPTPNSTNGGAHTPVHNSLPPRGHTPQGFGQSPGYSSSPVPSHLHHLSSAYGHHSDKSDLQLEEDRQLGISPIPASPVMAQPDFEPPTSLPEGEPILGEGRSLSSHQEDPTPSIPSQFSNPGTPADENAPSYQGYSNYPPVTCSPTYNPNVVPSPSYPPGVSHSPSYPPSVSCSPSYTPHNTHSPSYPPNSTHSPSYHHTIAQSPSYPPNSTQSPSYLRNATQSPSYPPNPARSPSYPAPPNQSPSFPPVTQSPSYPNASHSPSYPPNVTHSPSYSALTRSPSYPTKITHSPSYPHNSTQSPSYRPPTSQSPSSFPSAPTLSPSLNKPLVPGVHSPQMKSDVASKSLSGLESLVDQIPSLNEVENGPLTNGPCSNPTTPGPPNDPFSPGHGQQNSASFQSFAGGGNSFPSSHYGSPQPSNPYSPQFTSSSTNLSTNFSVSSLASSSSTSSLTSAHSYDAGNNSCITTAANSSCNTAVSSTASSSSFSVSSLTGGSPTPSSSMYSNSNSYSPAPLGPSPHSYDVMSSSILPPTPPMGPSFMGSTSMGSSMGALPTSMNMSGSQLSYHYPQYGESGPGSYSGPGHSSFPYGSSSPGFHVPSPRFPYPSPYPGGPYSQGYSQNAMLERIKQTGMGFGSF